MRVLVPPPQPSGKRTFDGAPVSLLEVDTPPEVPGVRDRLHEVQIDTFEADVRFAVRYLIERGIKGGCEIEGEATAGTGVAWLFDNPSLHPADVKIEPMGLASPLRTASTPAMSVVATAPSPTTITPSFPVAG